MPPLPSPRDKGRVAAKIDEKVEWSGVGSGVEWGVEWSGERYYAARISRAEDKLLLGAAVAETEG